MAEVSYPHTNRRLRTDRHIRELTSTVRLSHKSFIQPLFVEESVSEKRLVSGLNDVWVDTSISIIQTIEQDLAAGISKFLLFPIPEHKTSSGFDFGFASGVISMIKEKFGDRVWIAADLCLCSYTNHGHCGMLNDAQTRLLNHETVLELAAYALSLAKSGADCIAPSDMTDGRIGAIRTTLDQHGSDHVSIMSYAAKFSSQFYGPFRDACHSSPNSIGLQNRKSYQISPFNLKDAIDTALRDETEGADVLMVKPAGNYTDVIKGIAELSNKPIAAYHVSGEYAALELLVKEGLADRQAVHLEVWAALARAGATIIISYASRHAKQWIENAAL
ncbi:MAG: porphobilinogen synthase [bacterium]